MTERRSLSFRKTSVSFVALLSAGLLAACGGGGGSSTSSPAPPPPPPPPPPSGQTFSVDGEVAKGLILGGAVSVTAPEDGDRVLLDGTTSTTDGSYSLSIPATAEFDGTYVRVTVTGQTGAQMICDAPDGCGDGVVFGDTFGIGSDVSVQALVSAPGEGESSTVNVTALTDLAAALADDQGGLTEEVIANANSQVADLFGIVDSDLSSLPVIDITVDDVSGDDDALRSALVNAGIMGAAFESEGSLGASLETLRTRFTGSDGQLVGNEDIDDLELISLEDILGDALEAARLVTSTDGNIADATAELSDDVLTVAAREAGALTDATPSPNATLSALEKGKAFISDLRLVITALDDPESGNSFADFNDDVEAAADLIGDDAEDVLSSFMKGITAINDAFGEFESNDTLTSFETDDGITVGIVALANSDGAELTITDADIDGVTVSIFSQITLTGENSTTQEQTAVNNIITDVLAGDGTVSIAGSAANDVMALNIENGELLLSDLSVIDVQTSQRNDGTLINEESIEISELIGRFNGTLAETAANGLSFTGIIELGVENFVSEEGQILAFSTVNVDVRNSAASLRAVSLGLSGSLAVGSQSTDVTFRVAFAGENVDVTATAEKIDYFTYEVANNEITGAFTLFDRIESQNYDFREIAEVETLFSTLIETRSIDFGNGITQRLLENDDGSIVAFFWDDGSGDVPLVVQRDYKEGSVPPLEQLYFITTPGGMSTFYRDGPSDEGFVDNPPYDDIVEWIDQGKGEGLSSFMTCGTLTAQGSSVGQDTAVYVKDFRFVADETPITAFPIVRVNSCDDFFRGYTSYSNVLSGDTEVDPDATGDVLYSASVRQNVVGIDPEDPGVELSVFGEAAVAEGNVTGDFTTRIAFAGRRFETNAIGFEIVDGDRSQPLEIRNQDSVLMTITEDAATGEISGTLTLRGEELGEIIEEDGGIIRVRFSDGEFVTIL